MRGGGGGRGFVLLIVINFLSDRCTTAREEKIRDWAWNKKRTVDGIRKEEKLRH